MYTLTYKFLNDGDLDGGTSEVSDTLENRLTRLFYALNEMSGKQDILTEHTCDDITEFYSVGSTEKKLFAEIRKV